MTNPDAIAAGYAFIWVLGAACLIKFAYWLTEERPTEQDRELARRLAGSRRFRRDMGLEDHDGDV